MAYSPTNNVAVGDETLKSHYDQLLDNTIANYTQINVAHESDGSHKAAVIALADLANLPEGTVIGREYGAGTGVPTAVGLVAVFSGGARITCGTSGTDITIEATNRIGYANGVIEQASQDATYFAASRGGVGVIRIYPPSSRPDLVSYVPIFTAYTSETFISVTGAGASPDYWNILMKDQTGTLIDSRSLMCQFLKIA